MFVKCLVIESTLGNSLSSSGTDLVKRSPPANLFYCLVTWWNTSGWDFAMQILTG